MILVQWLALSLYVLFVGFCFCDGFRLHIIRKFVWFVVFLAVSISIFLTTNEFDVTLILPVPTLLAIILCGYEKIKSARREKGTRI